MSIYATLWVLRFPARGDYHFGCDWVQVVGQGVPAHVGTPTPGHGYEAGDPYAAFLPPAVPVSQDYDGGALRAVVVVTAETAKGTATNGQEDVDPLVVLSGESYAVMSFGELHDRTCDALRGSRPRLLGEVWLSGGVVRLKYDDGTSRELMTRDGGP